MFRNDLCLPYTCRFCRLISCFFIKFEETSSVEKFFRLSDEKQRALKSFQRKVAIVEKLNLNSLNGTIFAHVLKVL